MLFLVIYYNVYRTGGKFRWISEYNVFLPHIQGANWNRSQIIQNERNLVLSKKLRLNLRRSSNFQYSSYISLCEIVYLHKITKYRNVAKSFQTAFLPILIKSRNKLIGRIIHVRHRKTWCFKILLNFVYKYCSLLKQNIAHLCWQKLLSNAAYVRPDGVLVVPITALKDW